MSTSISRSERDDDPGPICGALNHPTVRDSPAMSEPAGTARPMELRWTGDDSATLSIGDVAIDLTSDEVDQLAAALLPSSPVTGLDRASERHPYC